MTKYRVTYGVWSFFFNTQIQFTVVVEAATPEAAFDIVKKRNPLAEHVYTESSFAVESN